VELVPDAALVEIKSPANPVNFSDEDLHVLWRYSRIRGRLGVRTRSGQTQETIARGGANAGEKTAGTTSKEG